MGQQKSHYYFVGQIMEKGEREIPMYGFHTGRNAPTIDWASGKVLNRDEFKDLIAVINPQVPVYVAMPRKTASKLFPNKQKYVKVVLNAYKEVKNLADGDGYMVGAEIGIKFENVLVQDQSTASDWPNTGSVHRTRIEKSMGRDAHSVVSVKLFVQQATLI